MNAAYTLLTAALAAAIVGCENTKTTTKHEPVIFAGDEQDNQGLQGLEDNLNISIIQGEIVTLTGATDLFQFSEPLNTSTPNNDFIHEGSSNLAALDADNALFSPIRNIEPLRINYLQVSPDKTSVFFHVGQDSNLSSGTRSLAENVRFDDPSYLLDIYVPLIGRPLDFNFPTSLKQLRKQAGDNATFTYVYDLPVAGSCSNDSFLTKQPGNPTIDICLESISFEGADPNTQIVGARSLALTVQDMFDNDLFFCSLLEYKLDDGALSCMTGTEKRLGTVEVAGVQIPVEITVPSYQPNAKSFDDFLDIRTGLKPLQFDHSGNRYIATEDPAGNYSEIHQIDSQGNTLKSIIPSEQDLIESFVVFDDEHFAYSFVSYLEDGTVDKGIKFYKDGELYAIPASSQYRANYQADFGSALMIKSHLLSLVNEGIAQTPISWNGYLASTLNPTSSKLLGCVNDQLVTIIPFAEDVLVDHCNFEVISDLAAINMNKSLDADQLDVFDLSSGSMNTLLGELNLDIESYRLQDETLWVLGQELESEDLSLTQVDLSDSLAIQSTELNNLLNAATTLEDTISLTGSENAPSLTATEILASTYQHNQINVNFSTNVQGGPLSQGAITLQRGGSLQDTASYVGQSHAALMPISLKSQNINQKIGDYDPTFFGTISPYQMTFDQSAILDHFGNTMEGTIPANEATFLPISAFYWGTSETADNHSLQLIAANRSTDKNRVIPRGIDLGFWSAYGDINSSELYRYFKLSDYRYGSDYVLTFDLLNRDDKHRLGLAVGKKDDELLQNQPKVHDMNLWQWPDYSGLTNNTQSAPVYGFSLSGKTAYQHPDNGALSNELLDNSDNVNGNFRWQTFRLQITNHKVSLAIQNEQGTYESLGEQNLGVYNDGDTMSIWLALPHYATHELDNILFMKDGQSTPIIEANFEDEASAFDDVPSLQKARTKDITPL